MEINTTPVAALHIKAEGTVELLTTLGDHRHVAELVGGHFDCVRCIEDGIVGYVHDEGRLIGLPINHLASGLFDQWIVGDVVVVGCFDSRGRYDGENHPVPDEIVDGCIDAAAYLANWNMNND